jgi:hypothetical protein
MAIRAPLQDALKYEGDTMGHCVGGYCPDVMSGRSRIFSLRDAKGEPHVTIETQPELPPNEAERIADAYPEAYDEWLAMPFGRDLPSLTDWFKQAYPEKFNSLPELLRSESIIQIKGKQNRAPKDDYLPFVQDFVKSGKWTNIGDMENTGLVKLPDGRYITGQQAEQGITAIPERVGNAVYDPTYLHAMDPEEWRAISQYFEGFAIGGRVDADRCFCRHPMSVR